MYLRPPTQPNFEYARCPGVHGLPYEQCTLYLETVHAQEETEI